MEQITSLQNPRIKNVCLLGSKAKARRDQGLFVVEGRREVENCLRAGCEAAELYACSELLGGEVPQVPGAEIFEVSRKVYEKMALREGTEGLIGVFHAVSHTLENLTISSERPFFIVLESVEKPGNLGAVLRTADACGADAVIVCDPLTDIYNPNLIRASIGGVFTVQTAVCTSKQAYEWLSARGVQIVTAQLQDSKPYYDTDLRRTSAIVFGTEADGLSDFWRERSDAKIIIPMLGQLDSLNVSASVAILSYEAVRQRRSTVKN